MNNLLVEGGASQRLASDTRHHTIWEGEGGYEPPDNCRYRTVVPGADSFTAYGATLHSKPSCLLPDRVSKYTYSPKDVTLAPGSHLHSGSYPKAYRWLHGARRTSC